MSIMSFSIYSKSSIGEVIEIGNKRVIVDDILVHPSKEFKLVEFHRANLKEITDKIREESI